MFGRGHVTNATRYLHTYSEALVVQSPCMRIRTHRLIYFYFQKCFLFDFQVNVPTYVRTCVHSGSYRVENPVFGSLLGVQLGFDASVDRLIKCTALCPCMHLTYGCTHGH